MRTRTVVVAVVASLATLAVTSCSPEVSLSPAADANDPACAEVIVALPSDLADHERRETTSQSTAAWGIPTAIILSCGAVPVLASELRCETVDGIDWLVDSSDDPTIRFTTFGRAPAVEVLVDYDVASGADVLRALTPAIDRLPSTGVACSERPPS